MTKEYTLTKARLYEILSAHEQLLNDHLSQKAFDIILENYLVPKSEESTL